MNGIWNNNFVFQEIISCKPTICVPSGNMFLSAFSLAIKLAHFVVSVNDQFSYPLPFPPFRVKSMATIVFQSCFNFKITYNYFVFVYFVRKLTCLKFHILQLDYNYSSNSPLLIFRVQKYYLFELFGLLNLMLEDNCKNLEYPLCFIVYDVSFVVRSNPSVKIFLKFPTTLMQRHYS